MIKKYSKQRELLIEELSSRKDHPTADEIYTSLRTKMPNISLGTVYRNLALLDSCGDIKRIDFDGADRFDATTHDHYHFACKKCKRVIDIDAELCSELIDSARRSGAGLIEEHSVMFYGICSNCLES